MATTEDVACYLTAEVTRCSVCLEQYKSPVSLECSHSFCMTCLSSHILSSSVNCDPPLGFQCPLCRKFIPAPGKTGEYSVEEWAKVYPKNQLLASFVNGTNTIVCKPCQEDGEDKKANSWCKDCSEALCDECVKCHKKSRPSRNHVIASISAFSDGWQQSFSLDKCEVHDGRELKLYCKEHMLPCCSICVTREHYGCKQFLQLKDVDFEVFEPKRGTDLQTEVEKMHSQIETIITDQIMYMNCIDDASEAFAKELSGITATIIDTVKRLEEKHLNELTKLTKESKLKLETSVKSNKHRLQYLQYWKEGLWQNLSNEDIPNENKVLSYIKLKNVHEHLKKLNYSKLEISIQTKINDNVQKLKNLTCLAEANVCENLYTVVLDSRKLDLKSATMKKITEFRIHDCNVSDGVFISSDKIVIADSGKNRLLLCNSNGVVVEQINLPGCPYGLCAKNKNEIFVTLPDDKKILKIDSMSLEIKQSVSLDCCCYGISTRDSTALIGARDSVVMFDDFLNENKSRTISDMFRITDDVALDTEGNVIFSSSSYNIVRKLDESGNVLFTYGHRELTTPFGLTVDLYGNIFVNGYHSNNIHILSSRGEVIRILDGIQSPQCIKFLRGTHRFLVGEVGGCVQVYELQENLKAQQIKKNL